MPVDRAVPEPAAVDVDPHGFGKPECRRHHRESREVFAGQRVKRAAGIKRQAEPADTGRNDVHLGLGREGGAPVAVAARPVGQQAQFHRLERYRRRRTDWRPPKNRCWSRPKSSFRPCTIRLRKYRRHRPHRRRWRPVRRPRPAQQRTPCTMRLAVPSGPLRLDTDSRLRPLSSAPNRKKFEALNRVTHLDIARISPILCA